MLENQDDDLQGPVQVPTSQQGRFSRVLLGPGMRWSTWRRVLFPGFLRGLPATLDYVLHYAASCRQKLTGDYPVSGQENRKELAAAAAMWCLLAVLGTAIMTASIWYGPIYLFPGLAAAAPGSLAAAVSLRRLARTKELNS